MGAEEGASSRIAVAVNADSMSTWFTGVFETLDDVLFDIRIEDQDHSARLLREGVVMGAVTTERTPVTGCRVQPLGVMRYVPVASKSYIKRYLPDGFTAHAAAEAPSLAWNRDDALQDMLVRKVFRRDVTRPQHFVPTAEGFGAAVRAGLGWGMFPDSLAAPASGGTAHSCGSPMCISMCRCTGSAGSLTARWSKTHHRRGELGRRRPAFRQAITRVSD